MTKKLEILDTDIVLQIWDTAGQERFHQGTLGGAFYRGADGALLVYDTANEKSFDQLSHWRDEALSRLDQNVFFPIVVVGNKVDLRASDGGAASRSTDQSAVLAWCSDNGYGHIETSARDGTGVRAAMEAIAALALDAQRHRRHQQAQAACDGRGARNNNRSENIRIDSLYSAQNSGCGGGACSMT